jgi:hypothetical protein
LYERTLTQLKREDEYTKQNLDSELEAKARLDSKAVGTPTTLMQRNSPNVTPSVLAGSNDEKRGDSDSDTSNSLARSSTITDEDMFGSQRNSVILDDTLSRVGSANNVVSRLSDSNIDDVESINCETVFDEVSVLKLVLT